MLHYVVVGVGVHAEVLALLPGPGEAGLGDAVAVAGAGQAVDGGIGEGVLQPSSLVDAVVCGLDAGDEGEGANGGADSSSIMKLLPRRISSSTTLREGYSPAHWVALPSARIISRA